MPMVIRTPGRGVVGPVLAISACVAGGCAVERTTAVELIGSLADAGADIGVGAGATDSEAPDAPIDATASASPDGTTSSCTMASDTCQATNGGCNVGSYYLYDNQYNCGADSGNDCGQESAYGCINGDSSDSSVSFVVTSNQPAGNTTVLSYSAMQENFITDHPLLTSFKSITSTFTETAPHVGSSEGVYDIAYDIWLNEIAMASDTQVLIWVDYSNRKPAGTPLVSSMPLGEHSYDVYSLPSTSSGATVVFYANPPFASGTVDLGVIFDWATAYSLIPQGATLWQIEFGVEIASTGGASATFEFDDFSITTTN